QPVERTNVLEQRQPVSANALRRAKLKASALATGAALRPGFIDPVIRNHFGKAAQIRHAGLIDTAAFHTGETSGESLKNPRRNRSRCATNLSLDDKNLVAAP